MLKRQKSEKSFSCFGLGFFIVFLLFSARGMEMTRAEVI